MKTIRNSILAIVLIVSMLAPWKLMVVASEAMFMTPGMSRLDDRGTDQYWDALALASRIHSLGWDVSYQPGMLAEGLLGLTVPDDHTVMVEQSLTWNGRYNILAHEGGHTIQPGWIHSDEQGEIFAESVAAVMSKNGLSEHARYLARYRMELIPTLIFMWPSIYHAAAVLQD